MSLTERLRKPGPTGFGYGTTAQQVVRRLDLNGRTILVTGCNSGLGEETMRVLVMRGATVIGCARTIQKAQEACAPYGDRAIPMVCELSDLESVLATVDAVKKRPESLDAIIANAGIMALPKLETVHGYEKQFFVNHIGHFLLVTRLLDEMSAHGRIVLVSSNAHQHSVKSGIDFENLDGSKGYNPWTFYGQSKLANLLFVRELAHRLKGTDRTAYAIHPGVIKTNLGRYMPKIAGKIYYAISKPLFLKSIPQGTATQVFVAVHPKAGQINGEYWKDCNVTESSEQGKDMELAKRLWAESERIVEEVL